MPNDTKIMGNNRGICGAEQTIVTTEDFEEVLNTTRTLVDDGYNSSDIGRTLLGKFGL